MVEYTGRGVCCVRGYPDAGTALFCCPEVSAGIGKAGVSKKKITNGTAGVGSGVCRYKKDPVSVRDGAFRCRVAMAKGKETVAGGIQIEDQKERKIYVQDHKAVREISAAYTETEKKTYSITVNKAVKQKAGYYSLVLKSDTSCVLGIKDAALAKGAAGCRQPKGGTAAGVWHLESAGGTGFRLKNENSGLYLTGGLSKKNGAVYTQRKYSAGNKGQIYRCYPARGSYYYIKNVLTKEYLYINGTSLGSGGRDNKKAWKFKFSAQAKPVSWMTVSGETCPVSLEFGKAFPVKGNVRSYYTIKKLTARVLDHGGAVCFQKTVKPLSCQYDLTGVDAALTFGKLAVGNHRYQILLRDSTGTEKTVLDREFVVYVPGGAMTKTLIYNSTAVAGVGYQSVGNEKEKKACASYALAYCNAILTGTAVSPHTYWSSSSNVDCVWSKGGYTTHAYASEQDVLQAAYGQLTAGKPCILHVTGKTGNQHWVTLIGYKNVVKASVLKVSNFIALDPWNGKVITVSDSYQVRTTYRLAYRNTV